jgi:hypothetical protein
MAEFYTDLTVKPTQTNSLADMLNLAKGVQSYQQAQQLNPLAVKQAQLATQQAEETTPLAIEQAKQLTKQSQITTESNQYTLNDKYATAAKNELGALLRDDRIKNAEKNPVHAVDAISEGIDRLVASGVPKNVAFSLAAPIITQVYKNPAGLVNSLSNIPMAGVGATGQQALQNPQVVTLNGVNYQYIPGTNKLIPIGEGQQAQTPMQGQPQMQGQFSAQPQGTPSLIPNEVPVGQGAGPLQLNAQQKALFDEGFVTKSNAQAQVIPAKEGRQTVRRVKELADRAASNKLGQFYQKGEKAIFGNTELDELTKNIANLQIQNAAVMGVKTDQQTQTVATASGSVNISPEALRDLADRTDASNTAVIKFNEGLKNYESKRGQIHAYVNTRNFKDAWASNYDPRVFMVQNINSSGMSKDAKEKAIAKINQGLSAEELKDLRQKSEAIKRLERGDYR